jgi:hypothetical protein
MIWSMTSCTKLGGDGEREKERGERKGERERRERRERERREERREERDRKERARGDGHIIFYIFVHKREKYPKSRKIYC